MLQMKLFQSKTCLPMPYEEAMAPRLRLFQEKLQKGSGAGGEFTGWVDLPRSIQEEIPLSARCLSAADAFESRACRAAS